MEALSQESKKIERNHKTVNYSQIVGDNNIVFFAENHTNTSIREHLTNHVQDLKNAGITHFAIEIGESANKELDKLNRGENVDLSEMLDPDYEKMVKALAKSGIVVFAVDVDQKETGESRESHMFDKINDVLKAGQDHKIAFLTGTFHTVINFNPEGVRSVRKRFVDNKVPSINVFFHGGNQDRLTTRVFGKSKFDNLIVESGLENQEFMLDFRTKSNEDELPFDRESDWIVHLSTVEI